jgi:hypothetical protein
MYVTTKVDITEGKVSIPKGVRGNVIALQWGDKGEKYIVEFQQVSQSVIVSRDNVIKTEVITNVSKKSQTVEEEREECQSKWKKELPTPTT